MQCIFHGSKSVFFYHKFHFPLSVAMGLSVEIFYIYGIFLCQERKPMSNPHPPPSDFHFHERGDQVSSSSALHLGHVCAWKFLWDFISIVLHFVISQNLSFLLFSAGQNIFHDQMCFSFYFSEKPNIHPPEMYFSYSYKDNRKWFSYPLVKICFLQKSRKNPLQLEIVKNWQRTT